MVDVRTEKPGEREGVRAVHLAAFPGPDEADLVDALREDEAAWVPDLSLVAVEGEAVVGHCLLTRAQLDRGAPILALAPMAVVPERQGEGIGGALVREALDRATGTDAALVVVVGHSAYYPRFGFEPAGPLGLVAPFEVPSPAFMAVRLPAWTPAATGTVVYPSAFDLV